jgi:uncharacterized membrane protein
MRLRLLPLLLALAFFATSALAAPPVRYRMQLITSGLPEGLDVTGMNNRGEVVGTRGGSDGRFPFVWRDGHFVDLRSRIHPEASFVEATGINDRSQIVGFYLEPTASEFHGFLADRRQVIDVQGPPTAAAVFLASINDREQVYGSFYDAEFNEGYFFNDKGNVEVLDTSFYPTGVNNSGALSGIQYLDAERRAAIWKDGVIRPIAPSPSSASDINDRGQVIGALTDSGVRPFVWKCGRLTFLPLLANQARSGPADINNAGRMVGLTDFNPPGSGLQVATVWDNGQVADLNTLIHPDDPLRAFVTLQSAVMINDRGEIMAIGRDSRVGFLQNYFLKPVHGQGN